MDIKSKKSSDRFSRRVAVFFLCALFFTVSAVALVGALKIDYGDLRHSDLRNFFIDRNYEESQAMQHDFAFTADRLANEFYHYRNEDYIEAGGAVYAHEFEGAAHNLFDSEVWRYRESAILADTPQPATESAFGEPPRPALDLGYDHDVARAEFAAQNEERIRQTVIAQQLRDFRQYVRQLEQIEGFDFYISDGEHILTNQSIEEGGSVDMAAFRSKAAWLIYGDGGMTQYPSPTARYRHIAADTEKVLFTDSAFYDDPAAFTVCLSFDDSYIAERAAIFGRVKSQLQVLVPIIIGGCLLALAALLYLIAVTGRKGGAKALTHPFDRVFTEVQITAVILALVGEYSVLDAAVRRVNTTYEWGSFGGWVDIGLLALPVAVLAAAGLWFILSCVRNLKAGLFFRNTIIWKICQIIEKICRRIYQGVHQVFDRQNPMTKLVIVALALILLSATVVLAPVMLVLVLVFAPRWLKKYAAVKKGVEEARRGNFSWRIPVPEGAHSEFDELARGVNEISGASGIAIQNELKNQRLKTDLISNVSHDLKTPLTSIITYVDLLKREGLTSPAAPEYLGVLEQKSRRLQKLTEDLFDAAKASSGAIPVRFARVDLLSLIRQGLGEMDAGFAAARLEVILKAKEEKYWVNADGQLLWRIVENLMSNVQKYAFEGSRVYIDVTEQGFDRRETILEMKNISRAPLNMPAEELMERFQRGDESRTTEGSGLGLAIAQDLARLQNGSCQVSVDGDLFKVKLILEPWPGEPGQADAPLAPDEDEVA
ncbi:MAG: HAMP domain-containing histidine kinase [Gracilibacteraceae bacterium]|nr:HAMP domain-containing histidine kinase [Gracilibacteraceae bacterium]